MLSLFCTHPARFLAVKKDPTTEEADGHTIITYHLFCTRCDQDVIIVHARPDWFVEYMEEKGETDTTNTATDD